MGKKPSSQLIADWVIQYISHPEWKLLVDVCYESVKHHAKHCIDTWAQDLAEENLHRVAEILRNKYAEIELDGEFLPFEVDYEDNPYIRSLKGAKEEAVKILYALTPQKFENICQKILEELGGTAAVVGGINDGGVDFVAENLCFTSHYKLPIPSGAKSVVVGQAKRYKKGNYVTEKELRDFVGSAMLKIQDLKTSGKIVQFTPVILAFWTCGDFHPDAKRYAKRLGIWTMNGWTMTNYIETFSLKVE